MNTKRLITASIFSLISASTALAADVQISHQSAPSIPSSAIVAPTFSWTGLYLGVQAGGFSGKGDMALVGQEKSFPLDKEFSPKLSGFTGGFYAGSNIDLGDSFIFGVDTDLTLSGKKHTKTITIGSSDNVTVENAVGRSRRSVTLVPVQQTQPSTQAVASGTPAPKAPKTSVSGGAAPSVSGGAAPSGSGGSKSAASGSAASGSAEPTPGAAQSAPAQPAPAQPAPVQPAPAQPAAAKPAPAQPAAAKPALAQPVPAKPAPAQSAPAKPEAAKPAPAKSEAGGAVGAAPAASAASAQPSLAARTIPSASLVLARSGSSNGSDAKASNGTSGAQNGAHHGVHGSANNANPHGGSHAGGHHGSGANPHGSHGTNPHASRPHGVQSTQAADKGDTSVYGIEQMKKMASELGLDQEDEVETLNHTFKQNWGGATRVRIGFAADRFMPYVAGGIAYGQFQDTVSISVKDDEGRVVSSKNLTDETKTMIGYTLGGGVDFSVLDNVIVRAEYRYSDFGKKKFAKEKLEINYKTNDFRVGVAYKF
ncbi:outer membrane protein [Bartonella sp. AU55XJBT]|uniref:outer membrane protein n=1 Tax=Bartonella sp. AU55XJBT TaxID=3019091 RepID=UPI00235FB71A|nr:outer membrane protein [Bartonella sp. AU55XJBT]